jgi:ribosomal protein S18 acetylase RimI-like enzyme
MIHSVSNTTIKQADANDLKILQRLSVVTFTDTFATYNTRKDMQMYIEKYFSCENLRAELADENNLFFIALNNEEPVGYLKLRLPQKHLQTLNVSNGIELERIYVLQQLQGAGLGYQLMQFAVNYAKQNGFDTLWLGVWERNEKAINFYKKCGFEIFGEHEFILGTDKQNDFLMKKTLANQALYFQ